MRDPASGPASLRRVPGTRDLAAADSAAAHRRILSHGLIVVGCRRRRYLNWATVKDLPHERQVNTNKAGRRGINVRDRARLNKLLQRDYKSCRSVTSLPQSECLSRECIRGHGSPGCEAGNQGPGKRLGISVPARLRPHPGPTEGLIRRGTNVDSPTVFHLLAPLV